MNKNYLYIIGAVILIGIICLALYFSFFRNNTNNNGQQVGSSLSVTEKQIIDISKLYVELFNTYEFGDYSNMSALGASYSLPDMQNYLSARFEELQDNTPEGYSITTTVNESDITILEYDDTSAQVIVSGESTTRAYAKAVPQKVKFSTTLSLYKVDGIWMIHGMDQK